MEFKGILKQKGETGAQKYSKGAGSVQAYSDYLSGYNKALEDSKATEMLEMLQNQLEFLIYCRDNMKVSRPIFNQKALILEKLIKEITEL